MKTRACGNCGTSYEAGALPTTCRTCGLPLDLTEAPRPSAKVDGPRARGVLTTALPLLVLGSGIVWFALHAVKGGEPEPEASPEVEIAVSEPTPDPLLSVEEPPSPAPVPADKPVISASFQFHRTVAGSGTNFYVLGKVVNDSAVPIGKPKLVIVFVDADGKEVGTASGFALADVINPGDSSYLSAIVTEPPPHEDLRFEVVAREVGFVPKAAEGLVVSAREPRVDSAGIHHFWGTVKNGGPDPASFVRVDVISFDEQDKLLGINFNYAEGEVLEPGASARFEVSAVIHGTPARFEYRTGGMVR
jgi:hypothetical protein